MEPMMMYLHLLAVATTTDPSALAHLLEKGGLATISALAIIALIIVYRDKNSQEKKHAAELKAYGDALEARHEQNLKVLEESTRLHQSQIDLMERIGRAIEGCERRGNQ